MKYTEEKTELILASYNSLFEQPTEELLEFMDLSRKREWSCLTSDFRTLTYQKLREFDRQISDLNLSSKSLAEIGNTLSNLSREAKVGYSMGLSPWTDWLLSKTFKASSRQLLIVVGHNWYPIVTSDKCYVANSPLKEDAPTCEWRYAKALPTRLLESPELAVLFLNLNPDFLPPGENITGETSTTQFIEGFTGLCKSVSKSFSIKGVISWGSPVWQSLAKKLKDGVPISKSSNIGVAALEHNLALNVGGLELKYYPFLHPSSPAFNGKNHSQRYQEVCDELLVCM